MIIREPLLRSAPQSVAADPLTDFTAHPNERTPGVDEVDRVLHRIISEQNGSASLNLATRYEGFDIKTNFSIYDLDVKTGDYHVIPKGELDQK